MIKLKTALRACTLAAAAAALTASFTASAQTWGPNPTVATLEATAGPYRVGSSTIARQRDFGGGTVYYPSSTADGPFGVIAVAPGFIETQATNTWLGKLWASHGFVVVTINVLNLFEYPGPRKDELLAALNYVVAQSKVAGTPYFGKVDSSKRAVSGHSMGGGGTLEAVRQDPSLKAAIPLAPWDLQKNFATVRVPTLIVSCETDIIAPNNTHSDTFYANLPATTPKALAEMKGEGHFCTTTSGAKKKPLIGKLTVSWLKRFVDEDTRYTPFLCGAPHEADKASGLTSKFLDNCPY